MKVFISWSGSLSRRVAETLRDWLPNVLQALEPWMSAEDIDKGARWSSEVANKLSSIKAGILCVTADNMEAPWLNFEAGALSTTLEKTFVSPYLIGLRPTDLKGPLVQFQATESNNKSDTHLLIATLNKALGDDALSEKLLGKAFETYWPELELSLQKIQSAKTPPRPQREEREILEELLDLVRDLAKRNPMEISYRPTYERENPFSVADMLGRGPWPQGPFSVDESGILVHNPLRRYKELKPLPSGVPAEAEQKPKQESKPQVTKKKKND
jgi:hypothetical protein